MEPNKKNLIYKALAITFGIMFFSLLFAQVLYERKINRLDSTIANLRDSINQEKLFIAFFDEFSRDTSVCELIDSYLTGLSDRVFETGLHIEKMRAEEKNTEEFREIQKEWVFLNMELWLRLIKYNKICFNRRNYVLYFYPYNCPECLPYTEELNRLNAKYGDNLWLFSMPAESDIEMVKMVMRYFGVAKAPAVVVNGQLLKEKDLSRIESILSGGMSNR